MGISFLFQCIQIACTTNGQIIFYADITNMCLKQDFIQHIYYAQGNIIQKEFRHKLQNLCLKTGQWQLHAEMERRQQK